MTLRCRRLALLCCVVLLGGPGLPGQVLAGQQIHVSTSELPPFSTERSGADPGALFEMVAELGRRTGMPAAIEFVPWKRAVFLTGSRPRSAIFPLTRSPERESQYRWLAPLYRENFVFVSLKRDAFDVSQPERDRHKRIGILRGSLMIKFLHDQGYQNIVEASSVEEGVRFLRRGIVDALCSDRDIVHSVLGGGSGHNYLTGATLRETTTWLGGSLDFSDAEAARFELAMKEMIDDGTYARLLKKYQLMHGE